MHWWLGPPAFRCLGRPQMHDPPWLVPPVLHHEERSDKPLRCTSGTPATQGRATRNWRTGGLQKCQVPPALESQSTWTGLNGPSSGSCSVPSRKSSVWEARHTHQHRPVAQAAAEVHQVDLPSVLLVHKTGPEIHPAGGELQGWQQHEGSQGHLLGAQASDSGKGEATWPTGVVF